MLFKERAVGPTPNGGSYSEIYYRDDNGNPADKEVATRCEIVEYDAEGRAIRSTLGFLEKKKRPAIQQDNKEICRKILCKSF